MKNFNCYASRELNAAAIVQDLGWDLLLAFDEESFPLRSSLNRMIVVYMI